MYTWWTGKKCVEEDIVSLHINCRWNIYSVEQHVKDLNVQNYYTQLMLEFWNAMISDFAYWEQIVLARTRGQLRQELFH